MGIPDDARAIIEAAHLCFAATVTADGSPNLSPKGTIRVWDDAHIFFLDIASPNTRKNLEHDPRIELNVVDQLSRRGYRLTGTAQLHRNDEIFNEATRRVFSEGGSEYPVNCVVLIKVESATELISPGYMHVRDEVEMRKLWMRTRESLDAAFEEHVRKTPFIP